MVLRILVTNDDGIDAAGLQALVAVVRDRGDVVVVAPDGNRSASGHSITLTHPIGVERRWLNAGVEGFAVAGTPVDAVKLAVDQLLPVLPDLVLSGINHGANLGRDVFYSGTVSAAMEAAFLGIPAVAISVADRGQEGMPHAARFLNWWLDHGYRTPPRGVFYNVNLPGPSGPLPTVIPGSPGRDWYALAGQPEEAQEAADTDVVAVTARAISVTPLAIDLTANPWRQQMRDSEVPATAWRMADATRDRLT